MTSSTTLIERLQHSEAFPHPADSVELHETHISWVLLAGDYAYKIKKPLDLGFLDFRELDRRRHFCAEELRLNRHFAPAVYLDVVPIVLSAHGPRIGGDGEPVEYAVQMRRFDPDDVLDNRFERGEVTLDDMREFAGRLVYWHETAPRTPPERRAETLALVASLVRDNFAPLEQALLESGGDHAGDGSGSDADSAGAQRDRDRHLLSQLQRWTERQLETLAPAIARRFDDGFFRDCHGDLHLGNLVQLEAGITPFDCIEFDPALRHGDVVADYAFLTMDLTVRGAPDLAARFLNRYLERSGDYGGMAMHALYVAYRCLVRAKIAVLRGAERTSAAKRDADFGNARRYLATALDVSQPAPPRLIAMHGLSGAGKSHVARELMLRMPAIRLRSDIERKRMQGLAETERSDSSVGSGLYAASVTEALYARLMTLAQALLEAGHSVILDASFLARPARDSARELAQRCGAAFVLCDVRADEKVLRERIAARQARGGDPSEADLDVLAHQRASRDVPGDDERPFLVPCHSDEAPASIMRRLAERLAARG